MNYSITRKAFSLRCLFSILMGMTLLSVSSCRSNDAEEARKRSEFAQIIDERSSKDVLNELYIASDGDTEALARILQVTPSSVERLRKGETYPTDAFRDRLKEVATYYAQHDKSFRELRSALDSEYKWYNSIKDWPLSHGWTILIILIVLTVLGIAVAAAQDAGDDDSPFMAFLGLVNIGALLIWGVCVLLSWVITPETMQDSYTESVNPNIELLVGDAE